MQLKINTIHIWTGSLDISEAEATNQLKILSEAERDQAARFKQPIHRLRYIAAHYQMRHALSFCMHIAPESITFGFSKQDKPFVTNATDEQYHFNLSHSDSRGVYAIGLDHPLGVDIEKVRNKSNMDIADRFFSKDECTALGLLSEQEAERTFYRIWSRKEAIVKATGKGLSQKLSSFSVATTDITETITVDDHAWKIIPLSIHPDFESALACHPSTNHIIIESIDDLMVK